MKGDKERKYYCEHCNILFDEPVRGYVPPVEPEPEPVVEDNGIEFLDNDEGKQALTGIVREKGWLYFIDKRGHVMRVKMAENRADKGRKLHHLVLKVGIEKEKGYLYYLDKDGDISRSPMKRNEK